MLLQMARFHSFLHHIFCIHHLLTGMWIASTSWQSAFISCEYVYLEMELVVHMVVLCLVFKESLYHSSRTISHSLLQRTRAPISTSSLIPSSLPSLLPSSFCPSFSFSSFSFPFASFPFSFLSAYLLLDVVIDSHLALWSRSPSHSPLSGGPYPDFFTAILVGVWERAGIAHSVYHCNWESVIF